jgi:Uma2 family endonuclease
MRRCPRTSLNAHDLRLSVASGILAGMEQITEHFGSWTIEDVEALPDGGNHARYEILTSGVLTISPAPETTHQRASLRLAIALSNAVPAGWEILSAIAVEIPGGLPCQPDLAVVNSAFVDADLVRFPPHAVLAVVEIVSPNSHPQDRIIKPRLYAAARISVYWRFELEKTPRIIVSELRRGRYVQAAVAASGEKTVVDRPFRVELDPAELVRRTRPTC